MNYDKYKSIQTRSIRDRQTRPIRDRHPIIIPLLSKKRIAALTLNNAIEHFC
jgi:hypothetical protein